MPILIVATVVLFVLKAVGFIDISYWIVFSPLWISVAVVVVYLIGVFFLALVAAILDKL